MSRPDRAAASPAPPRPRRRGGVLIAAACAGAGHRLYGDRHATAVRRPTGV
ncbi:hypothetical protein ACQ4WX_40080 [Streptomyces lasalocidi]